MNSNHASDWVRRFAPSIPDGEVLDLACGSGRHSRLLAALGHDVVALDREPELLALAEGDRITICECDLENESGAVVWPFEANRFSGIVVANYLHRSLFPHIVSSLAPKGVLIYETFSKGNERFGKPSNPNFLLAQGELLTVAAAHALLVVAFEECYVDSPKPAIVQRICALKRDLASSIN